MNRRDRRNMKRISRSFGKMNHASRTTALVFTALSFAVKPLNWPKEES